MMYDLWGFIRILNDPWIILKWFANCPRIILDWFVNHWESPQNYFRLICTSLRSTKNLPKMFFTNHQESSRFTENCPKTISDWFMNHWESIITENCPKTISNLFTNHQESAQNIFRLICKSLENYPKNVFRVVCESPRITQKCISFSWF